MYKAVKSYSVFLLVGCVLLSCMFCVAQLATSAWLTKAPSTLNKVNASFFTKQKQSSVWRKLTFGSPKNAGLENDGSKKSREMQFRPSFFSCAFSGLAFPALFHVSIN